MSSQYRVCPLFWTGSGNNRCLSNAGLFEKLLNDDWKIARVDTMPPLEAPSGAFGATNVYVLEKQSEEKQSEGTNMKETNR